MNRQELTFFILVCIFYRSEGSQVRLLDGKDKYEGRLEVYYDYGWANVCDDNFSNQSAAVVCKMLGLSRVGTFYTHGGGNKLIKLDEVRCIGTESDIMSCPHSSWGSHDCSHSEDVGVRCEKPRLSLSRVSHGFLSLAYDTPIAVCNKNVSSTVPSILCNSLGLKAANVIFTQFSTKYHRFYNEIYCNGDEKNLEACKVTTKTSSFCPEGIVVLKCITERLVNGTSPFNGRLQVWHEGVWGNVCDDGFDNNAASVVCRGLGLSWNGQFSSEFKGGTTPLILDDVNCNGTEASIVNCRHNNWKTTNCDHTEDVGIDCSPCSNTPDAMDLSLDGGHTATEGIAQIKLGKYTINICSDDFDRKDASVFCRELTGNASAAVVSGDLYSTWTRRVMQETFHCNGSETKLVHCPRLSMSSCPENHKAAIVCSPTPSTVQIKVPTPIIVNETVLVSCIATGGNPAPLIWWNCSGVNTNRTEIVSRNQVNSVLSITPEIHFNGEKCSCFVHQIETIFPKIELYEILNVHYPVLDGLNITSPILTENEYGNLTCEVTTGNPLPVLWWNCTDVPDQDITLLITQMSVKAILHVAAGRKYNGTICTCHAKQLNTSFNQLMESTVLNVHYAVDRDVSISSSKLAVGKPEILLCRARGGNPRPVVRMVCSGIIRRGKQVSLRYLTLSVLSVKPTMELDGKNCTCDVHQPSTNFPEIRRMVTLHVLRIDEAHSGENSTARAPTTDLHHFGKNSTTSTNLRLKESEKLIKTIRNDKN